MKLNIYRIAAVSLISLTMNGPLSAQAKSSIWDAIYTEEQAARGEAIYQAACVACHAADLRGNSNSPSLLGMSFMFLWEGRSVGELFTSIRTQMPSENPNSLPAQNYLDVLSFILQANSFPAGSSELTADLERLNSIEIIPSPTQ